MGFLSSSIRDEYRKKEEKNRDKRSFGQKAKDAIGGVSRAFLGNTSRLINQGYQEGKQVVNTAKMLTANATNNPKAFRNANEQSKKDYKGFKESGGLLDAGTITNEKETKRGDIKTGAKKIGANTIGAATEIIPFARGASLVKAGGKASTNLLRASAEGAGYGAVNAEAGAVREDKDLTLEDTLKNALLGGVTGAAGFGVGKGIEKGISKIKPVSAHYDPTGATTPELPDTNITTAKEAQNSVAAMATSKKSIEGIIQPSQRAQATLVGKTPSITDKPVTAVGEGAQTIAEKLDDQLGTYKDIFAAPKEVIEKLKGSDAIATPARKHDWLNHYEDTLSVLGRHFGKHGTDLGYKLAEGAKQVSDIQEVIRPSIDKTQKLLKELTKSKAGRTEVQQRIYAALEDRANAGQYIKNAKEQELFDETAKVFDFFKGERVKRGKSVVSENYSPRAAVRDALDAPERLLDNARTAFSKDVQSKFSRKRISKIPDAEINRQIIDLLPSYASSQAKEFGYEGAMKFAQEELPNVNPAYLTDAKARRQGEEYLRKLFSQVLDPETVNTAVRKQNRLIANTYKNQLGFSPKYAFQNLTQRFLTKSVVSKQGTRLAKDMDMSDLDELRKGSVFGNATVSSEANQTATNLGESHDSFFTRFDPGIKVEKGNIKNGFDRGAAQAIVESKPYKDAIEKGFKPKEASKFALQDENVRDLAIRRGNMVVNDTQFGANFVTKPEFFRKAGTFFGLSDKWFKQYQRFPQGMIQNMSTILRADDARALDILRRGNPAETNLVDYRNSAKALYNGVDDLIKGIKNNEITDVSLEVAEGYQKTLDKAIKELNNEMKKVSEVRGGKTAKAVGKMWAAASAIQFLFDGGLSMNEDDQIKETRKAVQFGAPVSIPTRDQNPLAGAAIPSSPWKPGTGFRPEKLTNFIPGVGLAVNRGREINRFVGALTGE